MLSGLVQMWQDADALRDEDYEDEDDQSDDE